MIIFKCKNFILLSALIILNSFGGFAHGDLAKRIQKVSTEIIQYPDSAQLYHQRGVLYMQHGDFKLAILDLNYCQKLNYKNPLLRLDIANVLFHLKKYETALYETEEELCVQPQNIIALNLKGKILVAQEKYTEAAYYFEEVIKYNPQPKPENYIEASKAWQLSKDLNAHCNAIEVLEKGITTLNGLITLQKEIIQLHLKNNDLEEAIALQNDLIKKLNRKEHAYYQLALIKLDNQMTESAHQDLLLAKRAIQQLPTRLLSTKAIQNLTYNINQILPQQ